MIKYFVNCLYEIIEYIIKIFIALILSEILDKIRKIEECKDLLFDANYLNVN